MIRVDLDCEMPLIEAEPDRDQPFAVLVQQVMHVIEAMQSERAGNCHAVRHGCDHAIGRTGRHPNCHERKNTNGCETTKARSVTGGTAVGLYQRLLSTRRGERGRLAKVSPVACVVVDNRSAQAPLLCQTWPIFAAELTAALIASGEDVLTDQVDRLRVVEVCGCADDFCQGFSTGPKPSGAPRDGYRNVSLDPPWSGELNLDVVHDNIVYVEVLYRSPLC
jgi:hypothetical protein